MNNFLFKDNLNSFIKDLDNDFKSRSLLWIIKNDINKLGWFIVRSIDNPEYREFLQSKTKNNQYKNIVNFYTDYLSEIAWIDSLFVFLEELISINFEKVLVKWYLDKSDYDSFLKKYDFNKTLKNLKSDFKEQKKIDHDYYWRLSGQSMQIKEMIEDFEKILSDFTYLKKKFFLDYNKQDNKIAINIEYIFAFFSLSNWWLIKDEFLWLYEWLRFIGETFLWKWTNSEYTAFIKTLTSLYKNTLWMKTLNKWDVFLITIYNKIVLDRSFDIDKIKKSYNNLLLAWLIEKRFKHLYDISDYTFFENLDFISLWFYWALSIVEKQSEYILIFATDIYEKFLEEEKISYKVFDEVNSREFISNNINDILLEDVKVDIVKKFFETWNINKKQISYKLKDIKNYKSYNNILEKWLIKTIEKLFNFSYDLDFYHIFLEPLSLASKKFVSSNFNHNLTLKVDYSFKNTYDKIFKKYKNNWLKIDDFINLFFEDDIKNYILFNELRWLVYEQIWNKLPWWELDKFITWEKQLFKNLLIFLARSWFVDLAWKTIEREIEYYSWDWYYSGFSYWLRSNYKKIEVFDIEYIKLKEIKIEKNILKDNYVSGNDVYLSLDTNKSIINDISKFTKLEKIDSYIVLNLNRDLLIKAKNDYNISSEDIFNVLKKLNIEIPKTLDVLINSVDNQKEDLSILPIWIPVLIENLWVFNEFLKLKMFNKYILYTNEDLKLIIFDEKFRNLEKTLSNRKILFNKIID